MTGLGIDKLLEWLERIFFDFILPLELLQPYERAVVTRLGGSPFFNRRVSPGGQRYLKTVMPGLSFKIPFGIDVFFRDNSVPTTADIQIQELETSDSVKIKLNAVVFWRIIDIVRFKLDVEDADDVISTYVPGIIRESLASRTWSQITNTDEEQSRRTEIQIRDRINRKVSSYGIEIIAVTFPTIIRTSLRDGILSISSVT